MTQPPHGAPPVCPRHPDRVAYVSCQRCGRPTCPDCQRTAAVGIQCVDCVAESTKTAPKVATRYGAPARRSQQPLVTRTLIVICVVVYVGQMLSPSVTRQLMFAPLLGGEQPWRFLTAAFVHSAGSFRDVLAQPTILLHIAFNMYALWIVGSYLEPLLGRAKFLALYLVSAVGGSVGYTLLASTSQDASGRMGWTTPTVGASGAVFGLFAALLVLNHHLGRQTGSIVALIAINAVLGFVIPNIAWQAHLGGAVTGAVVALLLTWVAPADRAARGSRQRWFWPAVGVLVVVLMTVALWRVNVVNDALFPF